ncbi:MAG: acyl-CoA synthetase [Ilumatobacteraceae bacterium]
MTTTLARRVPAFGSRTAIVDPLGSWTYTTIDRHAAALAGTLRITATPGDRVALLCTPGHDAVVALLACWHAGTIAVPMLAQHPPAELAYTLDDSGASVVVASGVHWALAERVAAAARLRVVDVTAAGPSHRADPRLDQPAMMIYTSGTTGRPKGVVHTHASLAAQVDGMIEAWEWAADDRIVLVLPLNHVHGIVNVTLCPLAVGACCEAPGAFDPDAVWERFASGEITVFMAVPTIYARLVTAWDAADGPTQARWSQGARALRLMVSGSAALPVSTLERWRTITGHVLLERYGMTEVGMALSNSIERRIPGHVGEPFPGVAVRVVDDQGVDVADGTAGELLLRGPQLFVGYWRRPDDTASAFTDGWFRTGDVAVHDHDGFRLLGRSSVDIIKTGGEKVSALEIEEVLRTHPAIADCAVVGIDDDEWGQRVAAAVVAAPGVTVDSDALRAWGKTQLAAAKVPTLWIVVAALPRNALGKVVKPDVTRLF